MKHPDLLSGIGRDGVFNALQRCICYLYGTHEDVATGVDDARHSIL